MEKADLHIHSMFSSDGEFEISKIVEKCIAANVNIFSITDHDTVYGIDEALSLANSKGISFIPGIEIDCNYEGIDLHLLGYNINWKSNDFKNLEADITQKVKESFASMIDNLHKIGFNIEAEAVLDKANGKLPTGELIAEVMLSDKKYETPLLAPYQEGGIRSDMPYINFYLDYFAQNKPAYVPIHYMSFQEAIEMVEDNGGIPIIAHPGLNLKGRENLTEKLLDKGAKGMEVFNNYHDDTQIDFFVDLAYKQNVIMTCGSDFHGKTKPLISIGSYKTPRSYINRLEESLKRFKLMIHKD